MIYTPGKYHILLFNEVGAKKKVKKATTFTQALKKQDKFIKKHPSCSSVIIRVMNNTRNINDSWGYK